MNKQNANMLALLTTSEMRNVNGGQYTPIGEWMLNFLLALFH